MIKTKCVPITEASLQEAAQLLRKGELVAFPTETVYGLGANALDAGAAAKIYAAKGRPSDNPLIVHVSDIDGMRALAKSFPETAQKLAEAFMPGPLTLVLPKKDCVPDAVSGGLPTVALRIPSHEGARRLLEAAGLPLAAPSANLSGRPSPTTAGHVWQDMQGRIPMILDGGPCPGGVESTVLSLAGPAPVLLRPGLVSPGEIESVIGPVALHPSILENAPIDSAASPGMKYRHYAPRAKVFVLEGTWQDAARLYDATLSAGLRPALLWNAEELPFLEERTAEVFFEENDASMAAQRLFACLRRLDEKQTDVIFAKALPPVGVGLSVMNRLLRAAAFRVLSGANLSHAKEEELHDIMVNYGIL